MSARTKDSRRHRVPVAAVGWLCASVALAGCEASSPAEPADADSDARRSDAGGRLEDASVSDGSARPDAQPTWDGGSTPDAQGPDASRPALIEGLAGQLAGPRVETRNDAEQWTLWARQDAGADLRAILEATAELDRVEGDGWTAIAADAERFACAWDAGDETVCRILLDEAPDDFTTEDTQPMAAEYEGARAWMLRNWLQELPAEERYERPFGCRKKRIGDDAAPDNNRCYVRKAPYGYLEGTTLAEMMLGVANETPRDMLVDEAGLTEIEADAINRHRTDVDRFDTLTELAAVEGVRRETFDKIAEWVG